MVTSRGGSRAVGLLAGYLADLLFADPATGHPVAAFGCLASWLEGITYRDGRAAGTLHTALLAGGTVMAGAALQRAAGAGVGRTVLIAAGTWTALGGTTLARTGTAMADLLSTGDLAGARELLPSLCGRDPDSLDGVGLARAACESVAENTSDAAVAPMLWAAVAGLPGVLGYRAINTLDAMIGHRTPRYNRFGWAAARLDDLLNYPAARISAILTAVCAPLVGGSAFRSIRAWRRDAARHPSPNAGAVEAAFAGALDVRLGGPTQYRHELEIRPTLGDGRAPEVADLRRAVRLSRFVQVAAVSFAVAVMAGGRSGRRVSPRP